MNEAHENRETNPEENYSSASEELPTYVEPNEANAQVIQGIPGRASTVKRWLQGIFPLILILGFCVILAFKNPGAASIVAIGTAAATIIRAWQRTNNSR